MKRRVIILFAVLSIVALGYYHEYKNQKDLVYDDNGQFSIYSVGENEKAQFKISVQREDAQNIVVKLKGINKEKVARVEYKGDDGVWNTLQSKDKLNYNITLDQGKYITAIRATNTDGYEVLCKGPTIDSVERINTRDGSSIIKLVARDNNGRGIWAAYYYDEDNNRIVRLNQLLMNPEKSINRRTDEQFSEYAKKAKKVIVISENGLAGIKDVDNKEIKDLTFRVNSVERSGQYVNIDTLISKGITLKKVRFYMSDGSIVEKYGIVAKEVLGSEEEKKIDKLEYGENDEVIPRKVELIGEYDYVAEKELVVSYDMLQIKNISTFSDSVIIEINNLYELDGVTYYYDDTSEYLTNINSAKIIIDKKDKLNKFVLHGAAGNNIEYYGANISSAKKIDSDGGKFILEVSEFLEGVSNDDIEVINLYDENDKLIEFDEPLINKAKKSNKRISLNIGIDDNVKKATIVRVFTKNGMMTEKKIDDMTAFGNRIQVKEVKVLDPNTLSVEIKDTFYVNKIEQVKMQKVDGTEETLSKVDQGDRLVYANLVDGSKYSKIAVVNQKGETSEWYELLQVGDIEPTDTGCRVNINKSVFGLGEIVWFYQNGEYETKEISGYGPSSIDIEGKDKTKESIMMIYVKDNTGVSLEYQAPNIVKAEKVESGGGRLNINIEKNNGVDIDKVILYDRDSKVLKTYNSISNLKLRYVLDDEIRACKRVKVVGKNGLAREAEILQIDPRIKSIELKKDKSIEVLLERTIENGIQKLEWKKVGEEDFKNSVKINKSGLAIIPKNSNVEKIRVCYDGKTLEYGLEIEKVQKVNVLGKGIWNKIKSIGGWDKKGELIIKASISDTSLNDTFDRVEIYVDNSWVKLKSFGKNTKEVEDQVFNISSNNIGFNKVRLYTKKGFVVESIIK